jgi:hypothetical protein
MSDDIITNVEATESDVLALKKAHYDMGGGTRSPAPVAQAQTGLNAELVQMLKMGKKFNQFQGIDRCIRVLDAGTPNQRHCFSMMVKDMTRNMVMCSSCDRVKDVNANPKTINSSMIKLSPKELEEFHMEKDPLENAKPVPVKKVKVVKAKEPSPRRPKVAVPNSVKIEVTLKELGSDPQIVDVLLQKTLDAIFELPVKNFREAEEIRVVKERVEKFLQGGK